MAAAVGAIIGTATAVMIVVTTAIIAADGAPHPLVDDGEGFSLPSTYSRHRVRP
jgi:hypothetical protein